MTKLLSNHKPIPCVDTGLTQNTRHNPTSRTSIEVRHGIWGKNTLFPRAH